MEQPSSIPLAAQGTSTVRRPVRACFIKAAPPWDSLDFFLIRLTQCGLGPLNEHLRAPRPQPVVQKIMSHGLGTSGRGSSPGQIHSTAPAGPLFPHPHMVGNHTDPSGPSHANHWSDTVYRGHHGVSDHSRLAFDSLESHWHSAPNIGAPVSSLASAPNDQWLVPVDSSVQSSQRLSQPVPRLSAGMPANFDNYEQFKSAGTGWDPSQSYEQSKTSQQHRHTHAHHPQHTQPVPNSPHAQGHWQPYPQHHPQSPPAHGSIWYGQDRTPSSAFSSAQHIPQSNAHISTSLSSNTSGERPMGQPVSTRFAGPSRDTSRADAAVSMTDTDPIAWFESMEAAASAEPGAGHLHGLVSQQQPPVPEPRRLDFFHSLQQTSVAGDRPAPRHSRSILTSNVPDVADVGSIYGDCHAPWDVSGALSMQCGGQEPFLTNNSARMQISPSSIPLASALDMAPKGTSFAPQEAANRQPNLLASTSTFNGNTAQKPNHPHGIHGHLPNLGKTIRPGSSSSTGTGTDAFGSSTSQSTLSDYAGPSLGQIERQGSTLTQVYGNSGSSSTIANKPSASTVQSASSGPASRTPGYTQHVAPFSSTNGGQGTREVPSRQRASTLSSAAGTIKNELGSIDSPLSAFPRSNSSDGSYLHAFGATPMDVGDTQLLGSANGQFIYSHQARDELQNVSVELSDGLRRSFQTGGDTIPKDRQQLQYHSALHQQAMFSSPHGAELATAVRRESDSARLTAALANTQIATNSSSRDPHSVTPTIMEEDEDFGALLSSGRSHQSDLTDPQQKPRAISPAQRLSAAPSQSSHPSCVGFSSPGFDARSNNSEASASLVYRQQHQATTRNSHPASLTVARQPHSQQPIQVQVPQRPSSSSSAVIQRRYNPAVRPTTYQQLTIFNKEGQDDRVGQPEARDSLMDDMIRHYITCPSRLGLGERTVLIMTSKVGQKSYGAEKRFLCPPPMVLLIGSSWWNACPDPYALGSSRGAALRPRGEAPTTLIPPRVNIGMSGESNNQDAVLEWATSSGRLIDVGNPSSEMAVSGRCIGKNLYITDVDEKRRTCETLVSVSVPGRSAVEPVLLGTFASKPIKIISKPSKKRQSNRNTECECKVAVKTKENLQLTSPPPTHAVGILHGSIVSLFHRLRSQTVSTRYLCVSGAPTWFKGSDGQPFLTLDQPASQPSRVDPPSCFVAKMTSWDPFIVYLIDTTKKLDPNAPPQKATVPGYPPPPPSALVPPAGAPPVTIHYNQRIVLQCLNTAVMSPVMVIRKVDKATTVVGGVAGPGETEEARGDPVSQLHKIALEVVDDGDTPPPDISTQESGEYSFPGTSGAFLACLNESVGMRRPLDQRRWIWNEPATPTTPATPVQVQGEIQGASKFSATGLSVPPSPTAFAAAYAAAQTQSSLLQSRHPPGSSGSGSANLSMGIRATGTPSTSPYTVPHHSPAFQPPESFDGGKVKRPRRVSSSIVPQARSGSAGGSSSKGRRRGQSLSVVEWQKEQARQWQSQQLSGLASDGDSAGLLGGVTFSASASEQFLAGASPGSAWTVEIADSDVWTIVGTDIARHTFYIPPHLAGGVGPPMSVPESGIAHLITTSAPAKPIAPVPVLHSFVPPSQEAGGQPYVTLLGENFTQDLHVYFGDWRSTHTQLQSSETLLCAPPPPASEAFEVSSVRVPVMLVRKDGVIFPSDCIYST